jgi:hypothetical protein
MKFPVNSLLSRDARTTVALNAPRPAHLERKIACRFTSGERLCAGCPLPRAAMPRDGADHHDLRGVCQSNRCGRESAEYIAELRTPRAFSRPLASRARSRAEGNLLFARATPGGIARIRHPCRRSLRRISPQCSGDRCGSAMLALPLFRRVALARLDLSTIVLGNVDQFEPQSARRHAQSMVTDCVPSVRFEPLQSSRSARRR